MTMSARLVGFLIAAFFTGIAMMMAGAMEPAYSQTAAAGPSPAAVAAPPTAAAPVAAATAAAPAPLTADTINAAQLSAVPQILAPPLASGDQAGDAEKPVVNASIAKLEILLDRVGASPGVIDGFDGENLRKAVAAYEIMLGKHPDGVASPGLLSSLEPGNPVMTTYTVVSDDTAGLVSSIPTDYAAMAKMTALGYTSVAEELAERFHMDEDFLKLLNPGAKFAVGETIHVADPGPDKQGTVTLIQADKAARQVRAYDADGKLLAAYPATIGSEDTPSPTGSYSIAVIVHNPTYTYNPNVNFKQGDNNQVLTIPPGPNGPVGSTWMGLSRPTYGIHGTPEPSLIDKTASHGCVRLTNWDAHELAGMVAKGVRVDFVS
jgi:lipoprotein-anchoring transpeptidase ErfK/SrfK